MTRLFKEFFKSERAGGFLLIFCALVSIVISNTPVGTGYLTLWQFQIAGHTVTHWINDGLMAVFFLLIGLELEREVYAGELSNLNNAILPIIAAIGGMVVPAGIYLVINSGTTASAGAGVPMATDIAFAIGMLSLLGSRVPLALKVFLTALAVIDDLGAILVIALFYTKEISVVNLATALAIFGALLIMNRLGVKKLLFYILGGVAMWYFMLQSGVHATISGVLLAFAIPFHDSGPKSPSYRLQNALHIPVSFLILPLFALANTSIVVSDFDVQDLVRSSISVGIFAGLTAGKPIGIFVFAYVAVALGICTRTEGVSWKQIFGVSLLGGIGFTMSIFIGLIAFETVQHVILAKIAILMASVISAILGLVWLSISLSRNVAVEESKRIG